MRVQVVLSVRDRKNLARIGNVKPEQVNKVAHVEFTTIDRQETGREKASVVASPAYGQGGTETTEKKEAKEKTAAA